MRSLLQFFRAVSSASSSNCCNVFRHCGFFPQSLVQQVGGPRTSLVRTHLLINPLSPFAYIVSIPVNRSAQRRYRTALYVLSSRIDRSVLYKTGHLKRSFRYSFGAILSYVFYCLINLNASSFLLTFAKLIIKVCHKCFVVPVRALVLFLDVFCFWRLIRFFLRFIVSILIPECYMVLFCLLCLSSGIQAYDTILHSLNARCR